MGFTYVSSDIMEKISIHVALAVILFFVQNWIGSKSYARGYIRFSLLDEYDEALSLNYVIKVFGPIVFLILSVAIFQYLKLNDFIDNIINVIYYYIAIRIILIFIYERARIVNWVRIIFYYLSIILVSNIIYKNFINSVSNLLPDLSELKNEIWLLIIVFIYQVGNGIGEESIRNPLFEPEQAFLPEFKKRKKKYVSRKYQEFKTKFENVINEISNNNETFNIVIYSILIFENFNRPRIIRWLERKWVKTAKRRVTQGIMQIASNTPLSDTESVKEGTKYLYQKYLKYSKEQYPYSLYRRIIKRQCPDRKYVRQVLFIAKFLIETEPDNDIFKGIFEEVKSEFNLYDFYD